MVTGYCLWNIVTCKPFLSVRYIWCGWSSSTMDGTCSISIQPILLVSGDPYKTPTVSTTAIAITTG